MQISKDTEISITPKDTPVITPTCMVMLLPPLTADRPPRARFDSVRLGPNLPRAGLGRCPTQSYLDLLDLKLLSC